MAIRHVVTIEVADGQASAFSDAFRALQTAVKLEDGCEQYELFQSLDSPTRMVILERWTNVALLERHMESERTRDPDAINAIIALWAPGTTPTVERYET